MTNNDLVRKEKEVSFWEKYHHVPSRKELEEQMDETIAVI
jgi:hypothetical protein